MFFYRIVLEFKLRGVKKGAFSYGGLIFWHMFLRVKKGVKLGEENLVSQLWEFTYE